MRFTVSMHQEESSLAILTNPFDAADDGHSSAHNSILSRAVEMSCEGANRGQTDPDALVEFPTAYHVVLDTA